MGWVVLLGLAGGAGPVRAQGAEDGRAWVSFGGADGTRTVAFPWEGGGAGLTEVSFEMGFRTSEQMDPGLLHDSFSVTLYRAGMAGSTTLAVADVFGLLTLPTVPGSLGIPPGALTLTSVTPRREPVAGETVAFAYEMKVSLPAVYRGRELGLEVSFFDNGDGAASLGYLRASVVPEPGVAMISGLGLGLILIQRTFRGEARK